MAKSPKDMTPSEINRRLESVGKKSSRIMDQLIAAGRGREKFQDTLAKTDPLARKLQAVNTEYRDLQWEIERRWGPGRLKAPLRNPKRKGTTTMARKKKRTAKQRAATKKMIAANRARLRKKTKTARRKTTRRKTTRKRRRNPQKARPGLRKTHLWLVFKCKGVAVSFVYMSAKGPAWTMDKAQAGLFRTKGAAHKLAKAIAKKRGLSTWHVGVSSVHNTRAQIVAGCKAGATYKGKI